MGDVVQGSFSKSVKGAARCMYCSNEWEALVPYDDRDCFECPRCHLTRGVLINRFGPAGGEPYMVCQSCGYGQFYLVGNPTGGPSILCPQCGDRCRL